ncbi:MAG: hypothetical protein ACFWT4_17975 [Citrobacter braakii]
MNVQINEGKATVSGDGLSQEAKEKILIAIGNISGIASVDDQVKTSAPASESQFYTVKSGDTLSAIAKQVYGNANLYNQIFEANKPMLKSPDKIYPGAGFAYSRTIRMFRLIASAICRTSRVE